MKKHGLKEKLPLPDRDDKKAVMRNSLGDFVRYHAIVSTSAQQTAFTSGNLIKRWTEKNRNYYEFKAANVISVLAYNSGTYSTKSATYATTQNKAGKKPVYLAINYLTKHNYNIDLMMEAMQESIAYFTKNFGPYQFDLLRIVEIPRYFPYAISLATTIPFTENLGFIANVKKSYSGDEIVKIPYPVWSTAHEVSHQWWGHQITPAEVQGAAMLTESLAQYSALKVLEKMYTKNMIGKFLENEQHTYSINRTASDFDEFPLATVANQQFIHYNKGAIVFYAISEYIGEEKFNRFLAEYLQNQQFAAKPYPTTKLFINKLKNAMPDSLKYIVPEWIEKVTLYDFEITKATYKRNEDLQYFVKAEISATKYQQDGKKKEEQKIDMNEYFPIEIKNSRGKILFHDLIKLKNGKQTLQFTLNRKPSNIRVDPYNIIVHKKAAVLNKFDAKITKSKK